MPPSSSPTSTSSSVEPTSTSTSVSNAVDIPGIGSREVRLGPGGTSGPFVLLAGHENVTLRQFFNLNPEAYCVPNGDSDVDTTTVTFVPVEGNTQVPNSDQTQSGCDNLRPGSFEVVNIREVVESDPVNEWSK
ncbi:hypothetical protein R3P38DRAFT_2787436 [Favolaschia claudopus]